MEDLPAPSFSLGFDLDIDDLPTEGEEEEEEADHPTPRPSPDECKSEEEEGFREPSAQDTEDFEGTQNLEEGQEADAPIRVLKRLRRGPPPPPPLAEVSTPLPPVDRSVLTNESPQLTNIFDEIEDFSSPEKVPQRCTDDYPSTQSHTTCSTTKFSLLHRGFLREHSDGKKIASKVTPASIGVPTSTRLGASNLKNPFPRLTISPIRKINLIVSDSDDSPTCQDDYKKNEEAVASLEKGKWFPEKGQKKSFWKDFTPKNEKIATPALDEFCKEYFMSARSQSVKKSKGEILSSGCSSSGGLGADDVIDIDLDPGKHISGEVGMNWDLLSPQPPAYQYFYHTDPRIRALVHQRLPHFIPLGTNNNGESQQFGAKILDYMSQFNSTDANGKPHSVSEKVSGSNTSKKQNKRSCYSVKETSNSTANWVNPKSKAAIPKDAGKRRVRADVLQSGQWFTDQDGKKVYVSKDGEQSTGRMAYMKYKKESGGFRKPKKKVAAKKSQKRKR